MRNNGKQVSNLMLKHVYCFWAYEFDCIDAWWENKKNVTRTVGWKDVIRRPVMWERPLYISELHSGIKGPWQATAKGFIKDLPSVSTDEYLSKLKWFFFSHDLVTPLAVVLTFFSWEQVICAPCWLAQALSGVRECVLSLLKVNFYQKILLSDGQFWEIVTSKRRTVGYIYFSSHQG